MKAQLSLDYIVSLIVFIGFVTYIFFQLLSYGPPYISEIEKQRLRSEVYQISELLVNDPGEPLNWNSLDFTNVERVGLSDETKNKTNVLSLEKIGKFNQICTSENGYDKIKSKIDTEYQFLIQLINKSNNQYLINCTPPQLITKALKAEIRRTVVFGSDFGELIVQMW
jgi:hypothetical protein